MLERKLAFILAVLLLAGGAECGVRAKNQNILVGSIPGEAVAKQMLGINTEANVDFIRMRIGLNEDDRSFEMKATYGAGKPNTRDFENGGTMVSAKGGMEVREDGGYLIYRLHSSEAGIELSLIQLSEQTFHVLSGDGKLLSGNGGWNYTLSRESPKKTKLHEPLRSRRIDLSNDPDTVVFSGRTPCAEIARELNMRVTDDCFKLKWKLTFRYDPSTRNPATFTLQRTFRRPEPLEGKWRIVNEAGAVIYKLEASDGSTVSFQRLDDSLFFLDNRGRLLKGNSEFGYTLDKQKAER